MSKSIFLDKANTPDNKQLVSVIGETHKIWKKYRDFVFNKYPNATEEWNYPGKNYGWSYRIKDKKRAIIYLLPRDNYFKVAFVFGQKATNQIMESDISDKLKTELNNARVYAEGRGIRIEIKDNSKSDDIKRLIEIKIAN